jgi:lysozyme family protein
MNMPPITIHTDDKQFINCMPIVIQWEGYPGDDDDPHDPGGRTHAGVIQREYNIYRQSKGLPVHDVWGATWNEVCDIYYISYWKPWCPQLWVGVDQMVFDQSVNQGPVRAAKNLQLALNAFHDPGVTMAMLRAVGLRAGVLVVDGHIGPATLLTLNTVKDRPAFLKTYYDWDMSYYRKLGNWARYGRGWSARAKSVYEHAVILLTKNQADVSTA